jgi:hypothetical protein
MSEMNLDRIRYCSFRRGSLAVSKKILERILTELDKILEAETIRISDKIVI